ncbi:MAG: peptidase domain-containing ABC transporter [Wenzhouxiangellaceae bacterium]
MDETTPMNRPRLVRQNEAAECGLACLAMVASAHGLQIDLASLRQRFPLAHTGATLRDVMSIADDMDFSSRALRLEPDGLADLKLPAILHWDLNHFVVLTRIRRTRRGPVAEILDPAHGEKRLSLDELSRHFTGIALELSPTQAFQPREARQRLRLSALWGRLVGLGPALGQLLVLSVLLQTLVLAAPFYLQLVVDEAVVRMDGELLLLLAIAFGALYLFRAVTEGLRSYLILNLGQQMSFQMAGNVVRHLLRLPTRFFELRHVGDLISRIGSIKPIQNLLTESVIAALIDSLMALTTAVLMLIYAWPLALVVLILTTLVVLFSVLVFPALRARQERVITSGASEQSHIMESLRAARAIKLFGGETQREGAWRNLYADVVNANIQYGRLEISITLVKNLLFGVQLVLVVYLGARAVMSNDMTLGMLFAFLAYRQNFADRAEALVTKGLEFRMLGLHLERLADIVYTPQEAALSRQSGQHSEAKGAISLHQVTFRYSSNTPQVLNGVDLQVEAGEWVAIQGVSGGGKSTLLKLMLGLLQPSAGEIRIDDQPLSQYGVRHWRQQLGVVMQDDQLLSGSIADNIAFFDPETDHERVRQCAEAARIAADIQRMPMQYQSLIGEMGAALSGGQRQRLLLARALYRRPRALFLDEGTANLDMASEREIADVIAAMDITRIIVAHRPELIRRADRVYEMRDGRLHPVR